MRQTPISQNYPTILQLRILKLRRRRTHHDIPLRQQALFRATFRKSQNEKHLLIPRRAEDHHTHQSMFSNP